MEANLLFPGALDFGMVVDGAVVMVENIVRHLSHKSGPGPVTAKPPAVAIRGAAHEVQRPVFFAIGIIITAYLPIFTLQRIEGRLFKPMAWTVAFALLGALVFSILVAPVLCGLLFRGEIRERRNRLLEFLVVQYRTRLRWAIAHPKFTLGVGTGVLVATVFLAFSGVIGSEFLPHLDEGSIWVRGSLSQSTSLSEGVRFTNRARVILASFPEAIQVISEV